jgi:crossover junction endodeoxyribonuclease RuvC
MRAVIGIDPGASGAIATLLGTTNFVEMHDMPSMKVKVGGTMRDRVDTHGIYHLLYQKRSLHKIDLVVIEEVQGFTGQSASAAFTFGKATGLVEGVCVALNLPYQLVSPRVWKKAMSLGSDKSLAVQAATRALPTSRGHWEPGAKGAKAIREGRAEAALMAVYGMRFILNQQLEAAE